MAWQTESTSRQLGTINSNSVIGGGAENYSDDAETLALAGQSDTWFVGVQNESTADASDFFIGLANEETTGNKLHIQNDGKIGVGTSSPSQELDVNGTINCSGLVVNGTNFSGLSSSSVWTVSTNDISYTAGTVTIGDGSSNKRDFKVFANATGNHVVLDASADTLTSSNISSVITGGNLTVSYSSGGGDVTFDAQNSNSDFKWDASGAWNSDTGLTNSANNSPTLFLGDDISTANKGVDFAVMGDTANKYTWWDASANTLYIKGTFDVYGTSNLDAVDIDGAVQADGAITVGVDDTGYDVKFFGATSGTYLLWDESTDDLKVVDSSGTTELDASSLKLGGSVSTLNTNGSKFSVQCNGQTFMAVTDSTSTSFLRNHVYVGSASDVDQDFKVFGTDSGYMFYDASTPEFEINDTLVDMNLTNHNFELDTTSGVISIGSTTGAIDMTTTGAASITIESANTAANSIKINAAGSNSSTTLNLTSAGTGTSAIDINSSGGVDVDAAGTIALDTSSGGISLGISSSGQAVTIGHSTSEVKVGDNILINGLLKTYSAGNVTTDDGTTAISAGDIFRGIVSCTPTADRSKATDTATNLISTLALENDGDSYDFSLINLATDGTSFITITAGTGVTLVGCMIVSAQDTAEDAFTSGVGRFKVRRTASDAVIIYRIA